MKPTTETSITSRFERFFTLASGVDHIESRSLPSVSIIKVFFEPGVDPDSAASSISNLAYAQLRRLPQGTLPPLTLVPARGWVSFTRGNGLIDVAAEPWVPSK